jgi:hypothetical protein
MKKTIANFLIICFAMSITAVTVSAAAAQTSIGTITTNPTTPVAGQSFSISVPVQYPPTIGTVTVNINGGNYESIAITNGKAVINNVIIWSPGSYVLKASVNSGPNTVLVSKQRNIVVTGTTIITEFPSVAFPIAAFLGLIFVVSRRKQIP